MTIPVLRPGDSGPQIRAVRKFLRDKFAAYAGTLADVDVYDNDLVNVVSEMQRRYGLAITGFLDYGSLIRMGWEKKPVIFTVNGFMGDMWQQQPSDTARALADFFEHQPVGFQSNAFPLGTGADSGVRELKRLINDVYPDRRFVLAGYSLGAIVTADVFDELRSGDMRHRWNDFIGAVSWGDPRRQSDGNSEGIAGPANLKDTPANYKTWANCPGDIYACKPLGEAGEPYTLIFNLVMLKWDGSLMSIMDEAVDLLHRPVLEIAEIVTAIVRGGMFFANQGPHMDYAIDGAVAFLRDLVTSTGGDMTNPAPPATTGTKSWVALIGSLLTAGIPLLLSVSASLPPQFQAIISGVLALLTMLGVYKVPNKTKA